MSIPAKQLEIDRVMNMVRAFGWEEIKREAGEAEVTLTIRKKLSPEVRAAAEGGGGTSPS